MDRITIEKYLNGSLSEKENLSVQIWIADHRDDEEVISWIDGYFEKYREEAEYKKKEKAAFKEIETRIGFRRNRKSARELRVAACAAALVLLPFMGYKVSQTRAVNNQARWVEVNVPYGATQSLTLPDGTALELNSGTKLMYPSSFDGKYREIFVDGEILADVAKDPKHPFLMHSGASTVEVTGTKFDFKSYQRDNSVEVALLEGSVEYTWQDGDNCKNVNLSAGDMMRYDKAGAQASISAFNVDKFQSMESGHPLRFFNESLADIASALERTFNEKIVIADQELASMHFLAFFLNNESLDEIFDALNTSGKMEITEQGNAIIISNSQY